MPTHTHSPILVPLWCIAHYIPIREAYVGILIKIVTPNIAKGLTGAHTIQYSLSTSQSVHMILSTHTHVLLVAHHTPATFFLSPLPTPASGGRMILSVPAHSYKLREICPLLHCG